MKTNPSLWEDKKFLAGFILVLLSIMLGFYGKIIFFTKIYQPLGILTGLSVYGFSWLLLLLGAFLVGWKTVKLIQYRIHHHVKKTVKGTYRHAKYHARNIHKRSIKNIEKVRHRLHKKIRLQRND